MHISGFAVLQLHLPMLLVLLGLPSSCMSCRHNGKYCAISRWSNFLWFWRLGFAIFMSRAHWIQLFATAAAAPAAGATRVIEKFSSFRIFPSYEKGSIQSPAKGPSLWLRDNLLSCPNLFENLVKIQLDILQIGHICVPANWQTDCGFQIVGGLGCTLYLPHASVCGHPAAGGNPHRCDRAAVSCRRGP